MPHDNSFISKLSTKHAIADILLKERRFNPIGFANHHLLADHLACCWRELFPDGKPIMWDETVSQGVAAARKRPGIQTAITKIRTHTKTSDIDGQPQLWKAGSRLLATNTDCMLEIVELADVPAIEYVADEEDTDYGKDQNIAYLAPATDGRFIFRERVWGGFATRILDSSELAQWMSVGDSPLGSHLKLLWELKLLRVRPDFRFNAVKAV